MDGNFVTVGSRATLFLLGAVLLALFAWLIGSSGGPRSEVPDPLLRAATAHGKNEAPGLEVIDASTDHGERTAVVEIVSPSHEVALAKVLLPATFVSGSLRNAADEPIASVGAASVSFTDRVGRRRASDTSQEGEYALHGLALGTHWVTARADGYRTEERTIDLRPDRASVRLDFTLQKSLELRVRVLTPEGTNLLEVLEEKGAPPAARFLLPIATREPLAERSEGAVGDFGGELGVGHFQDHDPRADALPADCMGVLLVDCELPVWVSLVHDHVVLQTQRIEPGQDEVTFVLSPEELLAGLASIRLRVLDAETGVPMQRARVMLPGGTHFDPGVTTDWLGFATIHGHGAGRFELRVRAKRYAESCIQVDALAGGITDLGTVALQPEVTVTGRVLDADAHPLQASFSLGVLDPTDQSVHWLSRAGFTSRGDGSFDIRGLGRAEYVIRTSKRDPETDADWKGIAAVSGNVLLDTRDGSITDLEVRLSKASRLVLHVSGRTHGDTWFRVLDERGLEVATGMLHGSEPRALELPPGSYRLTLTKIAWNGGRRALRRNWIRSPHARPGSVSESQSSVPETTNCIRTAGAPPSDRVLIPGMPARVGRGTRALFVPGMESAQALATVVGGPGLQTLVPTARRISRPHMLTWALISMVVGLIAADSRFTPASGRRGIPRRAPRDPEFVSRAPRVSRPVESSPADSRSRHFRTRLSGGIRQP